MRRALVIAPKNVALNVWKQETEKWDHLRRMKCSLILGTAAERRRALQADADLYVINRENVVWLMDELKGQLPFDMVILDELSSFKSTQAKRWKVLKKPIQSVRYVIGLTGTPAPNGYLDLWPQIYLLDGGERLGRRIGEYRDRYFTMGAHSGHIVYEWRLRIGAQDAINRKLSDLCLSMSSEDWLSLPPVIYNEIPVRMSPAARKKYEQFEKDKVLPLLDGKLSTIEDMDSVVRADTAAVVAGKLLQMANGAVYDDQEGVFHIHDEKIAALTEIMDTNPGENLLVFYSYKHDLKRIKEAIPDAVEFSGDQVGAWNSGKIRLLLCHPASAAHGLNLQQGGHIVVWFGMTWSLELYQQANARLQRPGQKESVVIHHLVCKDTIDERVLKALNGKQTTQGALLEALKDYVKEEEMP